MNETVENYWDSLIPEKCRKCECAHIEFEIGGDASFYCELDECYMNVDWKQRIKEAPEDSVQRINRLRRLEEKTSDKRGL